jgi:hypothetical protein
MPNSQYMEYNALAMELSSTITPSRLRIRHLVIGTAIIAVYFGVARRLFGDALADLYGMSMWVVWGAGAGIAICALPWVASRYLREQTFCVHPGEWLWVVVGVTHVALFALHMTISFHWTRWYSPEIVWMVPATVAVLLGCGATSTKVFYWRFFFVICVALYCMKWRLEPTLVVQPYRFFAASPPVDVLFHVTTALFLLTAIVLDLWRRESRPWTHWMGVLLWLWSAAFLTARLLYVLLVVQPGADGLSGAS